MFLASGGDVPGSRQWFETVKDLRIIIANIAK